MTSRCISCGKKGIKRLGMHFSRSPACRSAYYSTKAQGVVSPPIPSVINAGGPLPSIINPGGPLSPTPVGVQRSSYNIIIIIAYVILLYKSTKWSLLYQYWSNRHHVVGLTCASIQDKVIINLLSGAGAQ
jgi:hypothetical protein